MSSQIEAEAVEAQFEELAEQLEVEIEDLTLTIEDGLTTTSIAGADLVEYISEADDEEEDTSEAGEEQSTTEDTSEAGDDDEDTIGDGGVQCECGAVFDSKQSLYGHSSHCDEYESQTPTESEEEEDTSEAGENDSISDAELIEKGVSKGNIEAVRKYRSKNGVCQTENCPYGANKGADHCASHQSKTDDKDSKKSSSKKTTSYEDLTEGQQAAVNNLLKENSDDDSFGVEEAVQMV